MKKTMRAVYMQQGQKRHRAVLGFSLIELLIAMAVFLVAAGAAFSLFDQHVAMVTRQANLSGVNIGLRNAISQIQMDLSGAGENLLNGVPNTTSFSMGVVIQNNAPGGAGVAACTPNAANWAYPTGTSACFDSMTIVSPKPCTAYSALAGNPSAPYAPVLTVAGSGTDVSSSSNFSANDASSVSGALASDASCFKNGDEILLLSLNPSAACHTGAPALQYCMTVTTLTSNATVSSGAIQLTNSLTGSNGTAGGCPGASCSDPLGLITGGGYANALTSSFSAGSFVVDLGTASNTVSYSVAPSAANPSDSQLMRNGIPLTDQIIGFKIGADLWANNSSPTDLGSYSYNSADYCNGAIQTSPGPPATYADCDQTPPPADGIDQYDFALIRSIRVSLIGRTTPLSDPTLTSFTNGFDGGPYLVQQASIVVNLRGISISNYTN